MREAVDSRPHGTTRTTLGGGSWVRGMLVRPSSIDGKVYYLVSKPQSRKFALESLDLATGNLRWSKRLSTERHHLHRRNTYASSTPAADSNHVFVAFADPQHTYLKCFDHDGNEIWSRDFGTWHSQHGFGTSPRIFGDHGAAAEFATGRTVGSREDPGQSH